jgi:serine O-acetyltransferase
MEMTLDRNGLLEYVTRQLNAMLPDHKPVDIRELASVMDTVLSRTEYCFSKVNNRYFFDRGKVLFNHLHADQYAMFLYFTANTLYKSGGAENTCQKLFHLNRYLHGIDAFYEVELPEIFLFVHPLATVLGRGRFSDYFIVYQRCGIGSNHDIYPTMEKFVTLRPGSSVLGNCLVGENCTLAAGSLLIDMNLEKNSTYSGQPKAFQIRHNDRINPVWKV